MAKTNTLPITQNLSASGVTFVNADGTTTKSVLAAGANDSVVKSFTVTSNDTTGRNMAIYLYNGSIDYLLGTIAVPINSGADGTVVSVDALAGVLIPSLPFDMYGKRVIPLKTGWSIRAAMLVAVTAAKTVTALALAEDY